MEDGDQSAPMNLEEANDRTLNLVLEGGEDTLRRASAANLKVFQIFYNFYYLIQFITSRGPRTAPTTS